MQWKPCCLGSSPWSFQGSLAGFWGAARQVLFLGAPGPSPRPQPQDPGEGLLGAGVDEVGAGRGAEGFPVPAAKGREAVHGHEAFVSLPPAGRDTSAGGQGRPSALGRRGCPRPVTPTRPGSVIDLTSGLLEELPRAPDPLRSPPGLSALAHHRLSAYCRPCAHFTDELRLRPCSKQESASCQRPGWCIPVQWPQGCGLFRQQRVTLPWWRLTSGFLLCGN